MYSVEKFVKDIKLAGKKLDNFSKDINSKEEDIKRIIEKFSNSINLVKKSDDENQFTLMLNQTLSKIKNDCSYWVRIADEQIAGMEFINKFDKSIVFVVFGNVNVGKSSVGNFISGTLDELKDIYVEQPKFYSYDFAEKNINAKEEGLKSNSFKVNDIEETTSIQYFTLFDSLTWVDTPGIHSINSENEALAKEYVNFADMVLFVTSSSSPVKQDELVEISRLIEDKKPLLIVINKSDISKAESIDGKVICNLIPKSNEDRRKQEQMVRDLFKDNDKLSFAQSVDSTSISVKLAEKGLKEKSEDIFNDSGLPIFYEKLGETLKQNAIEIKQKAPKDRVNSLINRLINGFMEAGNSTKIYGIVDIKSNLLVLVDEIDSKIEAINSLEQKILKSVKEKAMLEIDIVVHKIGMKVQNSGEDVDVHREIIDTLTKHFNEQMRQKIAAVLEDYKYKEIQEVGINIEANLSVIKETTTYTSYHIEEYDRAPNGLVEWVGKNIFKKNYKGYETVSEEITKTDIVGVNSSDVIKKVDSYLEEELRPFLKSNLEKIVSEYFEIERETIKNIIAKIDKLERELDEIKF